MTETTAKYPGKVFVDANAVSGCLHDFLIFDCRYSLKTPNYGRTEHAKEHVRDAVFVDMDMELSDCHDGNPARHPLPLVETFVEWCKAHGIAKEKPALCYDDESGAMGACRLWWMLDSLGAEAYVINGGMQACRAADFPMEAGAPKKHPPPVTHWPFRTSYERHYRLGEIPPNAIITDARAPERFHTTVRPYGADSLPGHIEGAINLPYLHHLTEVDGGKILRDEDEIRSNILRTLNGVWGSGAPDLSHCIFSCGSGVSACINIALARHLGLGHPFLYCGSWSEYSGVHRLPIIRSIIDDHGMWIDIHGPLLGTNPKANLDISPVLVGGTSCDNPDEEVRAAVAEMHMGEKATVYFKNGHVVDVVIPMKQ